MHKLLKRFEDLMIAITFAEASEYDEAKRAASAADEQQHVDATLRNMHGKAVPERAGR